VLIRPMPLFAPVNHSAPSGPTAIANGTLLGVSRANSLAAPVVVIRPMLFAWLSLDHEALSGRALAARKCGGSIVRIEECDHTIIDAVEVRAILNSRRTEQP